jgi:hypothetical protein
VLAFGVDPQRRRGIETAPQSRRRGIETVPQSRRRGIGAASRRRAARQCRIAGCYQMRSRSPVTSGENYALKIAAGYVLHPSDENDSC